MARARSWGEFLSTPDRPFWRPEPPADVAVVAAKAAAVVLLWPVLAAALVALAASRLRARRSEASRREAALDMFRPGGVYHQWTRRRRS